MPHKTVDECHYLRFVTRMTMATMTATAMRLPTTTGMMYLEYHLRRVGR